MMDCDARRRAMRSKNMKTVTIRLTMMTDNVKNFVSLVNRYPYDMDLRSGRYVVDAKSILGIFSIDLCRGAGAQILWRRPAPRPGRLHRQGRWGERFQITGVERSFRTGGAAHAS